MSGEYHCHCLIKDRVVSPALTIAITNMVAIPIDNSNKSLSVFVEPVPNGFLFNAKT